MWNGLGIVNIWMGPIDKEDVQRGWINRLMCQRIMHKLKLLDLSKYDGCILTGLKVSAQSSKSTQWPP